MTGQDPAPQVPGSLFEALAAFQADLPDVPKTRKGRIEGKEGKRGYDLNWAGLPDVTTAVMPRLGALGLAFTAKPTMLDGKFGLAYSLVHVSGQRDDGFWPLRADMPPQQVGAMITYARRYCLEAVTGIAPASDDDHAGASAENMSPPQTATDAWQSSSRERPPPPAEPQQQPAGPPAARGLAALITARLAKLGVTDPAATLGRLAGRDVGDPAGLTQEEAARISGLLNRCPDGNALADLLATGQLPDAAASNGDGEQRAEPPRPAHSSQVTALGRQLGQLGVAQEHRLATLARLAGRYLPTATALTQDEAGRVKKLLDQCNGDHGALIELLAHTAGDADA